MNNVKRIDIKQMCFASLFVVLMIVGAYIKIPTPFVPFTLQTFFCLLSGVVLGKVYGPISQIIYILLGLIGLPIFAAGGGIGYVLTPTFGFILSFPIASFAVGILNEHFAKYKFSKLVISCLVGVLITYIVGSFYFYIIFNFYMQTTKGIFEVLLLTVIPFIPFDIIKAILAAFIGKLLYKNAAIGYLKR